MVSRAKSSGILACANSSSLEICQGSEASSFVSSETRLMGYASRTGTIRNLEALRKAGWRLLVSATGQHQSEGFRYAIDNGAWTSFRKHRPFDENAFLRLVEKLGEGADFIVLPDIVAGGVASLEFSLAWRERLRGSRAPLLLPVQDGISPWDVEQLVGRELGIFVGGSTAGAGSEFDTPGPTWDKDDPLGGWKWRSVSHWARLARSRCAYLHVGRVNSKRRIRLCAELGAQSFDGTSCSMFSVNVGPYTRALDQGVLVGGAEED